MNLHFASRLRIRTTLTALGWLLCGCTNELWVVEPPNADADADVVAAAASAGAGGGAVFAGNGAGAPAVQVTCPPGFPTGPPIE